jgi:Tfp pilus assembly protein FimT
MKRCCRSRKALTLMELIVVLAILVILGGLVVQVLPNLMTRTHLAKCSDTIANLNNAWMRSFGLNVRYPDGYDSLLAAGGSSVSTQLTTGLSSQISAEALTASEVAALRAIGLTRVFDLAAVPAGASVTYDSAPLGAPARVLATGGNVAVLNLAAHAAAGNPLKLKRHLVRQADGSLADNSANVRYLIFGIGPNCTGVGSGKLIQEAPVHFAADDSVNPSNTYQRYLVVFSLVRNPGDGSVTAHFEAAAGNDGDGPSSADDHIRQFHEQSNQDG